MEEEEDDDDICKVVLLGEAGVGKTSIISRFYKGTFEESLMSTNGASYVCRNLTFSEYENRMVKFEIWDTAGQEQYRALNKIFYKDASICILVYDITSRKSFNALKEYWIEEIRNSAPKGIILGLAANKSDLDDYEAVSEDTARNFANEINAIFMYTSACKFIGIDELFRNVGCKYIDPNYKGETITLKDIKNTIKNQKDDNINIDDDKDKNKDQKSKKVKLEGKSRKDSREKKKKKFC